MTVLIDNQTDWQCTEEYTQLFHAVVAEAIKEEGFPLECEVSVMLVSPEKICELNQQFRSIPKETDVLSFPQYDFNEEIFPLTVQEEELPLGDIVIAVEIAKKQAKEYGHTVQREMAFLTAHSMLHLFGYDHVTPEEESVMVQKQEKILERAGYARFDNVQQKAQTLLQEAKKVMERAYAPYSQFRVGAALLGVSGKIYTGCNVENASYGISSCAERNAVYQGIASGEQNFTLIAIVSGQKKETLPCGVCRQVLFEFMPKGTVITEQEDGKLHFYTVEELLPKGFRLE